MKAKTDPRVDAYIERSANFARPILEHLRKLVHTACPDVEETLKWSMPSFTLGGRILCGMAAFKAHCAFHFWHADMDAFIAREIGAKRDEAMGHLGRIASRAELPDDGTLLRCLAEAKRLHATGTSGRRRAAVTCAPKPELRVPNDLAASLKRNKKAAAAFDQLSPSHRREYLEWIAEAKREETRQKRLLTTVAWLAEGKSRNWKYEKCSTATPTH